MKHMRTSKSFVIALCTFGLIGAAFLPIRVQAAGLSADAINATKINATNYIIGRLGVGTTNPVCVLDVTGNLRVTGTGAFAVVTGNGSALTNITAAQVGAVATTDPRYLAALTNAAAFDTANAAAGVQAQLPAIANTATSALQIANSKLSTNGSASGLSGCPSGADPLNAAAGVQAQLPAIANTATSALQVANSKLSPTGNGSQLTGLMVSQISGALSTSGSASGLTGCPSGADAIGAAAGVQAQLTAIANTATSALQTANSKLSPTGNGSQLTGLMVGQVSGALSANGSASGLSGCPSGADPLNAAAAVQANLMSLSNALFQALQNIGPYSDVSMGNFSN